MDITNESRRRLLGIGAAGVLGLATQHVSTLAAQAQPDQSANREPVRDTGLKERSVTFRSGTTDIPAFQVAPAAGAHSAILLVHEIWGLNAHIRDLARRFARQGYLVLAPDLFVREGTPQFAAGDRHALLKFLSEVPDRRVVGDLQAAIEYSQSQGAEKVASIGFCMGGLYSFLLACKSDQLNAAIDFYGRIVYEEINDNKPESPLDLAPQLKCPLLCNFGEKDTSIPQSDVKKFRDKLKTSAQPWAINVYPGAGHAFYNDTRPNFHPSAAADAGTQLLAFLKKYL